MKAYDEFILEKYLEIKFGNIKGRDIMEGLRCLAKDKLIYPRSTVAFLLTMLEKERIERKHLEKEIEIDKMLNEFYWFFSILKKNQVKIWKKLNKILEKNKTMKKSSKRVKKNDKGNKIKTGKIRKEIKELFD